MLPPIAPFRCQGCGSADGCLPGCPEAAEAARALTEIEAEIAAAHATCAAEGHVGAWSRCDPFSRDADYVCDRCGTPLDEPPPSNPTGDERRAVERCARGEHRAAGESMPGACADCGIDWSDMEDDR